MYRYFLAHRFTVSRPINLLGILGVMLGVWALIVVVSIFDGYREQLKSHFTMTTSDLVLYKLDPRADFRRIREAINADENVEASAPRMIWVGLLHPRNQSELRFGLPGAVEKNGRFVTVTGIDPILESATTGLGDWLKATDDPELRVDPATLSPGDNWMLVSERKADAKKLHVGDSIEMTTARVYYHSSGNTTKFLSSEFKVAGAYKTQHAGYDNLTVLVSIDHLRELISQTNKGSVNEIAIRLHATDPESIRDTRRRLFGMLRSLPDFQFSTPTIRVAGEEEQGFMQAITHQSGLMKLVLFVIMVVAAFLTYSTLSMMVTEKKHDIGVLSALGGTRAGVLQVFLSCGFAISLVGTILGVASGCLTSIYLNDFNEWLKSSFDIDLFPTDIYNLPGVPYDLNFAWISIVVGASLVLGLVAAALPAQRAMSNDPLQCLRDQ